MKKFVNYIMQTQYNDIKVYFDKRQNKFVGRQIGKNHCKKILYYKNGNNKSGSQYMFYPIKYAIKCFGFKCPTEAIQNFQNGYYDYEQEIYVSEENMKQIKNNFKKFIEERSKKRYLTILKTFEKQ